MHPFSTPIKHRTTLLSHIYKNCSSWINLISTNQPHFVTIYTAPFNCQYQITFAKRASLSCIPHTMKSHLWDYAKTGVDGINKAVNFIGKDPSPIYR